jgi:hypothetical protein
MRYLSALLGVLISVASAVVPVVAQVKIETKPELREPLIIVPGPQRELTRPPDAGTFPEGPKVMHDPAFFEGLSAPTATGRAGFSGWTAPNQPVAAEAAGFREHFGWFALGFTFTWGGPPTRLPSAE